MLIKLENISHNFGEQDLFFDVNLTVYDEDRIALIGQNGSGKTTLLNILTEIIEPLEGSVIKSNKTQIEFLKQFRMENPDENLISFVKRGINNVDDIMMDKSIKGVLIGLGFPEETWERKVKSLSGGELTRLSLGKTLAGNHNLLLLDEPTNHLDLYSIKWLTSYLKKYKGAIITVSHDRNFLNNLCNKYWEINNYQVWEFKGPFDNYMKQRENLIYSVASRKSNLEKEMDRLEKMIKRYRKWATEKMVRQAIIRERSLEKIKKEYEQIDTIEEERAIKIKIPEPQKTGYKVLEVTNLKFEFNNNSPLLKDINFEVNEGEKVSIIGNNGCGKSTLLKIINNKLIQNSGHYKWGHNIKIGYLDQVISSFNRLNDIMTETWKLMPEWPDYEVRKYLGRFGFVGENVFKTINTLSGGELTRLALAKEILNKPNVLILDEPTNHLDILTVQTLEETLKEFKGAIILVSHDEKLLKNISDKFIFIKNGKSHISTELDDFLEEIQEDSFKLNKKKKDKDILLQMKKIKNRIKALERRKEEIIIIADDLFKKIDLTEKELIINGNNYSKVIELMEKKEKYEKNLEKITIEEDQINQELEELYESSQK
ncbi:ribosomal protection-like ABC-F family protein [Oceanotoga teriensis]|uniref:ATP-binding cassette subfamily F protein 3 n=1 Tax=Oceanotoga teriensis TaxID=515440 RepID=A0AA45HIA4_9BACT|nr:ABC-F family ATP-binding cassette domain-containing protein [Oceanotoga teriensis]MDO7975695.1 ATP-binding cassette domain-containing protein [Oceanotoga teriensis]PWJ90557.1 ATP-binding cassette subfamily F protein 3 [Oceanotoga teriensis]